MVARAFRSTERHDVGQECECIPSWDGDPRTWETYSSKAATFVEGTPREKRYLCGPQLQGKLCGAAAVAVEGYICFHDAEGADKLLAYLYQRLGKQAVPDLGRYLEEYFIKLCRKSGESMASWASRADCSYQRLRQAFARVSDSKSGNNMKNRNFDDSKIEVPGKRMKTASQTFCQTARIQDALETLLRETGLKEDDEAIRRLRAAIDVKLNPEVHVAIGDDIEDLGASGRTRNRLRGTPPGWSDRDNRSSSASAGTGQQILAASPEVAGDDVEEKRLPDILPVEV